MSDSDSVLTALLVFENGLSAGEEASVDAVLARRPVFLIGSDSRCHLMLLDPQAASSHAAISRQGDEYSIRATLPNVHVYVNDALVEKTRALRPGDVIRIGETALRFTIEEREPDTSVVSVWSEPAAAPAPVRAVPQPVLHTAAATAAAAAVIPAPNANVYFPPQEKEGGISGMAVFGSLITLMAIVGFIGVMFTNLTSSSAPVSRTVPVELAGGPGNQATLIMFDASWCTYCKQQRPIVNRLAREYAGDVEVRYVDIDSPRNRRLVAEYNARSVPMIVIKDRDGRTVATYRGLQREDTLRRSLERAV